MFIRVGDTSVQQPYLPLHQTNFRLTGQIKKLWLESGCVYGYPKIHLDLRYAALGLGYDVQYAE